MTIRARVARPRGRPVFRVAREPWSWPDPARRHADLTFGHRWDDPLGRYRVLYVAGTGRGAYLETLARFRLDPVILAAAFVVDPSPANVETIPPGIVPGRWLATHSLGTGELHGRFAVPCAATTLGVLRGRTSRLEAREGIALDAAALRRVEPRAFTQGVSRILFELDPVRPMDGIAYASRHGDDEGCYAIFERRPLDEIVDGRRQAQINPVDPELLQAVEILGLRVM